MKLHPEIKELMAEAMSEGLRWWKKLTPDEINTRVRQQLLNDQKPLRDEKKILTWKRVYKCTCLDHCYSHLPWCDGKSEIVFESMDRAQEINGRTWFYGSAYGPGFIDDGGK